MITKIELQNFKSFEELNLELTNFNIFFGLNGSGKSSVIQSLLLLRQSFLNNSLQSGKLSINGNYVKLGLGKDIYFEYAQNEEISFNLSSDKDKFISPFKFLYRPDTDVLDVKLKNPVDFQKLIDQQVWNSSEITSCISSEAIKKNTILNSFTFI